MDLEVREEFNEEVEVAKLAEEISEEITGRATPDKSKLSLEDFVEYRMRQKVIELIDKDAPMRDKWKEFTKFEKSFLGELRSVPRTHVRRLSLKSFTNYYKEVRKLQEDISKEISESYQGGTDEASITRD